MMRAEEYWRVLTVDPHVWTTSGFAPYELLGCLGVFHDDSTSQLANGQVVRSTGFAGIHVWSLEREV